MVKETTEGTTESRVTWGVLENAIRVKLQGWIQDLLEEEVTELSGRGKSERRDVVDGEVGYRNGYGKARHLRITLPLSREEPRA